MDMVTELETTLGAEMDPAATSVRGMLAAAQADVTKYMGMVTMLETTLGAEMDPAATSVRGMLAAATARADQAETDRDKYKAMVEAGTPIKLDDDSQEAVDVGGALMAAMATDDAAFSIANSPTPTISRTGDAITITGLTDYEKQAAGPPAIDGWDGSVWAKGTATEYVTLYTDIRAPKGVEFNETNLRMLGEGASGLAVSASREVTLS